jgi:SAM-dependent methyltransferase
VTADEPQDRGAHDYDTRKRDAWAGRARAYADTFAHLCAHTVDPLIDAAAPAPGAHVLDVGCGTGAVAEAALRRGCRVTGIDPDAEMLDLAQHRAPGATLVVGTLPHLPVAAGVCDLVAANFVLNHVGDPRAAAAELARVTRPGGTVAAAVWPQPPAPLLALWQEVVEDAGVPRPPAAQPLPADLDFARTVDGLSDLLSGAGLTVRRAWSHEFVHVVDPDAWWAGPERGVATIGATYLAQDAAGRAAMRAAYDRLSRRYLGPDGLLHLPGAAVLVVAHR